MSTTVQELQPELKIIIETKHMFNKNRKKKHTSFRVFNNFLIWERILRVHFIA
jgi:hypothetical protein